MIRPRVFDTRTENEMRNSRDKRVCVAIFIDVDTPEIVEIYFSYRARKKRLTSWDLMPHIVHICNCREVKEKYL